MRLVVLLSALLTACGSNDNPAADGGSSRDGGAAADAAAAADGCAAPMLPFADEFPSAASSPRCDSATRTCIQACTSAQCVDACLAADSTPAVTVDQRPINCQVCFGYTYMLCLDQGGCHPQIAELNCCVEQKCSGSDPTACAMTACAAEYGDQQTCGSGLAGACGQPASAVYDACFP